MRKLILFICLWLPFLVCARSNYYVVEEGDQLGIILYSIGHKRLWAREGKVNLFKRSFDTATPGNIFPGTILKIEERDLIFKNNILRNGKYFQIKEKIRRKKDYDRLAAREVEMPPAKDIRLPQVKIHKSPSEHPVHEESPVITSFGLYAGAGGFVASNQEDKDDVQTSTFTGLQPMLQLKGIYSHSNLGSLSFDGMAKKIFTSEFSFPINFDYRFQLIPKWNLPAGFRVALSHSSIRHSYVGKVTDEDKAFDLKSNFFGFGLVLPRDTFWLELYLEKAYSGEMSSKGGNEGRHASKGYRVDTELVYPLSKSWWVLPGLNYYSLSGGEDYSFSVLEARLVVAREFNF